MAEDFFMYKGYKGSITYSEEDNVWYGIIKDIKDLISYESDTEDGLEYSFRETVDEYLKED